MIHEHDLNFSDEYKYSFNFSEEIKLYNKEIEIRNEEILTIQAVLNKYPNACKMRFKIDENPQWLCAAFCSPDIVKDDVEIDLEYYDSKLFILNIVPYVNLSYELGLIKIYHPTKKFKVFSAKNNISYWNSFDKEMLSLGFQEELINNIYKSILKCLSENKINFSIRDIENVPEYILKYLPFI